MSVQAVRGYDRMDYATLWADFIELLPYIGSVFGSTSIGLAWWIKRKDERTQAALEDARRKVERQDELRILERKEMSEEREAFYDDIKSEVDKLRTLYAAEQERGLTLRTSLVEASLREKTLMIQISNLTQEVEKLQAMVSGLQVQLAAAAQASRENVTRAIHDAAVERHG